MRRVLFLATSLLVLILAPAAGIRASASSLEQPAASLVADVDFVSGATGWVALYSPRTSHVGNACDYDLSRTPVTIVRTIDGGRHWTAQLHFTGDSTVFGNARLWGMWMRFVNATHGFVSGPATQKQAWLYQTRDGGKIWRKLRLPGIPGGFIGDPFTFPSAGEGWLLANVAATMDRSWASVFHTVDAGTHWVKAARFGKGTEGATGDLNALVFRDAHVGWVTGGSNASPGFVYATSDGGRHWSFQSLGFPKGVHEASGTPYPPAIFNASPGFLPVEAGEFLYLYTLGPDGTHWVSPRRLPARAVDDRTLYWQLLSPQRWWVGAGNTLRRTVNVGRTWQTYSLHLPPGFVITQLDFVGPNRGWAIATAGFTPGYPTCASILLRTTDAGAHWASVAVGE